MGNKLTGKILAKFEAKRDVWQEVLDGVREIKTGGRKRTKVDQCRTSFANDPPRNCTLPPILDPYSKTL